MAGVLYFGNIEEKPLLARFNEEEVVQFSSPRDSSTVMWSDFEEIKEDEVVDEEEQHQSEFWKRRRRNKFLRRIGTKRKLHIAEIKKLKVNLPTQAASVSSFEGTLLDTKVEDATSQYILLQVLKPDDSKFLEISSESHAQVGGGAIVKVIPVGDWYHFQKPPRMQSDVTLDQINIDFDRQEKLMKQKREKFKQIKEGSFVDDAETQRSKRNVATTQEGASKLFGSTHFKRKGSILKRMDFKGHMADSGIDVEEEMERDGNEEDNDADFNCFEQGEEDDDEEEYVDVVQAGDNEVEELLGNRMDSPTRDSDDEYMDSDDDTDVEEEREAILRATSTATTAKKAIGGSYGEGSGFQSAAREFAAVQRANRKKEEFKQLEVMNESDSLDVEVRVEDDVASKRKRRRAEVEECHRYGDLKPSFPVHIDTKNTKLEADLILTDDNIKAHVSSHGGKVKASDMYKPFKKLMKEQHGDNHKKVFMGHINRICRTFEDPTLGMVFMLKVNPKLAALPSTSNT